MVFCDTLCESVMVRMWVPFTRWQRHLWGLMLSPAMHKEFININNQKNWLYKSGQQSVYSIFAVGNIFNQWDTSTKKQMEEMCGQQ